LESTSTTRASSRSRLFCLSRRCFDFWRHFSEGSASSSNNSTSLVSNSMSPTRQIPWNSHTRTTSFYSDTYCMGTLLHDGHQQKLASGSWSQTIWQSVHIYHWIHHTSPIDPRLFSILWKPMHNVREDKWQVKTILGRICPKAT
jgi:hypothetical protein